MNCDPDTLLLTYPSVCDRIQRLTSEMMRFWKSAYGWAPIEAAGLLEKSMLEWQASLAESLPRWLESSSEGDLILAWANIGALVEGQLKLFLSVWYHDYSTDAEAIKDQCGRAKDPDGCGLEPLRQFFVKRIWIDGPNWNPYVGLIQQRRNAIHAFRARDIGTFSEWREELRRHLSFVRDINSRLPYPDSVFVPTEF